MLSYAEFVRVIPVSLSWYGSFGAENVGTSYITTNLRPSLHQGHTQTNSYVRRLERNITEDIHYLREAITQIERHTFAIQSRDKPT